MGVFASVLIVAFILMVAGEEMVRKCESSVSKVIGGILILVACVLGAAFAIYCFVS